MNECMYVYVCDKVARLVVFLPLLVGPKRPKQSDKNDMMKVCIQETESVMSATPATQNDHGCKIVPRLPRGSEAAPRASRPPKPGPRAPPSTISATPATQNDGRCEFVPRLPREAKVDVTKCHACHAKWRGATGVTPA